MFEQMFYAPCIAVAGLGKEGCTTISWLRRMGYSGKILAADLVEREPPDGADEIFCGEKYLKKIRTCPVIFRTPGISLEKFLKAGCPQSAITSQSAIILEKCRVIGVTGTKGKSTVSSLIAHILNKAEIRCHLAGNLGTPFFELPDEAWDEIIVAEFSSHQLQDVCNSPHIAVLLEIVPEHLDYYASFEDYVLAKMNIIKYQNRNDYLITSPAYVHGQQAIANAKGKIITFGQSGDEDFIVNGTEVVYGRKPIVNASFLRGSHNVINVAAALAACTAAGVNVEEAAILTKDFLPLPYRLETVAIQGEIEFIDDPLATTPEALIAAIEAFDGRIGAIICGGHERSQDYTYAAHAIVNSGAKLVITFPTTGERIASNVISSAKMEGKPVPKILLTSSMDEAISAVLGQCSPGDVCLHSPGAPSFGQFQNYKERSKAFREAILSACPALSQSNP